MTTPAGLDRHAAATAIDAFLRAIGRDPTREPDLAGTGARVTEAFLDDLCAGYAVDTQALLRGALVNDAPSGLVVVKDIPIVTTCPHHLLVATGSASVAIHVKDTMCGLGTIAALVDAHARRLTLQERIGENVARDLEAVLAPEWVAVRLVLAHGCMIARGERAAGSRVETVATRGEVPAKRLLSVYKALGVGGR
jgi:GTP cyclohydrolase I